MRILPHPLHIVTLSTALLLGACCGDDDPSQDPAPTEKEEVTNATPPPPLSQEPKETPAAAPKATKNDAAPAVPIARKDALERLALAPIVDALPFEVSALSVSLEEVTRRVGKTKVVGVQLKIAGIIYNRTGHTITDGLVGGALVLNFEGDVKRLRFDLAAVKTGISPNTPWRTDQARLFHVETEPFAQVMLEYTPTLTQARLFVDLRDPVGYAVAGAIFSTDIDWRAARAAPVKGSVRVFKAEAIKAGLRGAAVGKLTTEETVTLLYQSGAHFRVRAAAGTGWIPASALAFTDISPLYEGAKPHTGEPTATTEAATVTVHSLETLKGPPEGISLDEGQRLVKLDLELQNTGEKPIPCDKGFFLDYGPGRQRSPHKANIDLGGTLTCPETKGKLAPGATTRGALLFPRERHDVPVALGYQNGKSVVTIDVYRDEETAPYRK